MAQSIEDFAKDYRTHIDRVFKTGKPALFDAGEDGDVVVMDALAYEEMQERLDLLESVAGIREGIATMRRGEGKDAVEAVSELIRKYGGTE